MPYDFYFYHAEAVADICNCLPLHFTKRGLVCHIFGKSLIAAFQNQNGQECQNKQNKSSLIVSKIR